MLCRWQPRVRLALLALLVLFGSTALPRLAHAQQPQSSQPSAVVQGEITTQSGTIALGAAKVTLNRGTAEVAQLLSEGDGKFRFEKVEPGTYTVAGALEGFQSRTAEITAAAGETVDVRLDLQLAMAIEVRPTETVVPATGTLSAADSLNKEELEQMVPGGGVQSALRLLASVIEVPGGVAIKGGRPNQSSLQIGPGLFVDPATGLTQGSLPDDAVESVTVLPNPYAVEFGRFSSGLVVIQTRRAPEEWKTRLGSLDPAFRTRRGQPFNIQGIAGFSPRMETGGPLVKDKVYLHQSAQYRYRANDVASRPEDELRTSHRLSVFTRLDATLSDKHSLTAVGGVSPTIAHQATLGTFIPPEASVDTHSGVFTIAATERTVWSDTKFSETTVEVNRFAIDVTPQGSAAMQMLPQQTLGNFYNRQDRGATSFQVIHSFSGTSQRKHGLHMFKAGFDAVLSAFDVTSDSRSIFIRRVDGTLARQLDYTPATDSSITSTDFALFAQDRIQPNNRWYLEFGGRLDRDGVIDRFNATPRVGAAFLLNATGTSVIRGGYGLFFERTPSTAGVFTRFEAATETRFATDGVTPLGPPLLYKHTIPEPLRTARSSTWDVSLDHRLSAQWSFHAAAIDRQGARELIIDRVEQGDVAELRLHSDGRSKYREIELGVNFTGGRYVDLKATYVRSYARADLNAMTVFYDSVMAPVLGDNDYAPARADTPHRLLTRWRTMPTPTWLFVGVLDWRTGLPFSPVNEYLDFVGPRNRERFPTYFRLDLGLEHKVKLFSLRPWVGVRVDNILNSFLPADVQANISSPNYGQFYNSEYRQVRIQFRFER